MFFYFVNASIHIYASVMYNIMLIRIVGDVSEFFLPLAVKKIKINHIFIPTMGAASMATLCEYANVVS